MLGNEESEYEPDVRDPGAEAEDVAFDVTAEEDPLDGRPDESEVPTDVRRTFWILVLQLKVAILGVSIGLVLAYAWGPTIESGLLVLLGLVAAGRAYRRIRRFQRS